jgi:hypothetical protein
MQAKKNAVVTIDDFVIVALKPFSDCKSGSITLPLIKLTAFTWIIERTSKQHLVVSNEARSHELTVTKLISLIHMADDHG